MDDVRLDALLRGVRADLDMEAAASGALTRVRAGAMAYAAAPAVSLPWRRIAAAMLVAGLLGGALDLAIPISSDSAEIALNDPLFAIDLADAR